MKPSTLQKFAFFLILFIAAYFRFRGIGWALPTDAFPHFPFHPDEPFSIDALKTMNVEKFQFNPIDAHIEGTLAYYIWYFSFFFLKALGWLQSLPNTVIDYSTDYGRMMLAGRTITAFFSWLSVIFVYLTTKKLSKSVGAALIAALVMAIAPFEIIYGHYFRPHIFSNFFIVLTLYWSCGILESSAKRHLILGGFGAGLAAASRYHCGLVILVPFLFAVLKNKKTFFTFGKESGLKSCGVLFIGLLLGLVIADPFLFLDFANAKKQMLITAQFATASQFSVAQLLDFTRVWIYISDLIPHGTMPLLWVLWYLSVIYLLFVRSLYKVTIPYLAFLSIYLYIMAKGYAAPIYIRATLPMFPFFAILTGLALWVLWKRIAQKPLAQSAVIAITSSICLLTGLYDSAYVSSMRKQDPREALFEFIKVDSTSKNLRIGISKFPYTWFVVKPVFGVPPLQKTPEGVMGEKHFTLVDTNNPEEHPGLDYYIVPPFEWPEFEAAEKIVDKLTGSGRYTLVKVFENPLAVEGMHFVTKIPPHDLQYPRAKIYVLKETIASKNLK